MKPCVAIPIYNHGATIAAVVESLAPLDLPCIVVNDGSAAETRSELERLQAEVARVGAVLRRVAQRKEERDLSLAEQDRYLPLTFDIMGEIRACSEEIVDGEFACACTLGILKRIEERDTELERLQDRTG